MARLRNTRGLIQRWKKRWEKLRYHPEQARMIESDARFKVVPAGRRCLEKGTDVATPSGPVPIELLKIGDEVIGYNEDGEAEITKVVDVWNNGEQEVVSLYSSNEKVLATTDSHELLCCDVYYHNENLKPEIREKYNYKKTKVSDMWYKSRVKKKYTLDLIKGGDKKVENTYILGALLGDGCCSRDENIKNKKNIKKITISSEDRVIPTYIYEKLGGYKLWDKENNYDWFIKCHESIYDLIPFYDKWCSGKRAHEKIADWGEIDQWNKESCFAFLAGIIDTDGSFYYGGRYGQLFLNVSMQAESVIDACCSIIYKYFQEKPKKYIDKRTKYKNGSVHMLQCTNNLLSKRVYRGILPYLQKKNNFDISKEIKCGTLEDRIYLTKKKDNYKAMTYDITVGNSTNLYMLHNKALVTSNSGKTELLGKRLFLQKAIAGIPYDDPKYFVAAPTRDQVKRIYWNDLKIMTRPFWAKEPSESNLIIYLKTGAEVHAVGMDKPERIEGSHWDGCVLDEYANMKPEAWVANIRPALSTPNRPPGWCYFIGVPEGRNHYYDMYREAQRDDKPEWDTFTWHSADIMDPAEVESAKRDMDELTFKQEFQGDFISFSGRAYYNFDEKLHVRPLKYRPSQDLFLCFDFNINPGVCAIIQEGRSELDINGRYTIETRVIDEVHIERNSNTILVSKQIAEKYKNHKGRVLLYGDASGGAGGSAKVMGSDWEIVRRVLYPYFQLNLFSDVPRKNPRERERINAVNSRLLTASSEVNMYVDPKCVNIIKDFEGVTTMSGGSGAIDKKANEELSHLCFSGDTKVIHNELGVIDIKDLPKKGMISGFDGEFINYNSGGIVRGNKKLIEIFFDEFSEKCTEDHLFLTQNGWKEAIDIEKGDICIQKDQKLKIALRKFSMETVSNMMENIICQLVHFPLYRDCIEKSMKIIMEKFLKDIAYTTKTKIDIITIQKIWNACQEATTQNCTCQKSTGKNNQKSQWKNMQDRQLPYGTKAKKTSSGTRSKAENTKEQLSQSLISAFVNLVDLNLKQQLSQEMESTDTAQKNAKQQVTEQILKIMKLKAIAYIVENHSEYISIDKASKNTVIKSVHLPQEKVYCPTTSDGFFSLASGLIVKNSDGIGYYMHRRWPIRKIQSGETDILGI